MSVLSTFNTTTEVRPLSKALNSQLLPGPQHRLPTAPGVCALGWIKCRAQISLLVILCIIVNVTEKKSSYIVKCRPIPVISKLNC